LAELSPQAFPPPDLKHEDHETWVLETLKKFGTDLLKDRWWRINSLYWIQGEEIIIGDDGEPETIHFQLLFRPRPAQIKFWNEMWYFNLILKSRQHGFTTFIDIFILDQTFFTNDIHAGIIAHNREDAGKIFDSKVEYPYRHLPEFIKESNPLVTKRSGSELSFAETNSMIRVGTSLRSGTYQLLHISEYGKLCAKFPEKAAEVRTGALNTVHAGSLVFIESTAEGQAGDFHDKTIRSHNMSIQKDRKLSKKDYKFHFYAWWQDLKNILEPRGVPIVERITTYLNEVEEQIGIKLSPEQRAWYAVTEADQGEFMKREHPSTWKEAFESSLEGTYFSREMRKAREQGRICKLPVHEHIRIDTYWDIGYKDPVAIWFGQDIGGYTNFIDYYEDSGEGVEYYVDIIEKKQKKYGWKMGKNYGPHDVDNHHFGSGASAKEIADKLNFFFVRTPQIKSEQAGIDLMRSIFYRARFDETNCEKGISCLDSFRKEWNSKLGTWREKYMHDWASHAAKAFQTFGIVVGKAQHSGGPDSSHARPVEKRRFAT